MNDRLGIRVNRKQIGLFHNFTEFSKLPNERLSFTLPNHSSFKLAVTVTSTQSDADHRKQPEYTSRNLSIRERVPSFEIDIKTLSTFQHIFTTMLDNKYEVRKLSPPFLSDITVAVSGSEATKGTSGTKRKVKETRETEIEEISDRLFLLRV